MTRVALLTGATGFLGGRLCMTLLRTTPVTVYCLVRGRTDNGARDRLHARLRGLDGSGRGFDPDRIKVVRGNLTRPRMGLPAAEYAMLSRSVDTIYHCAATVNLAASYDHLVPGNVTATRNVVGFAGEGRRKTLHHVSTLFIFSDARRSSFPEVTEETEPTFAMSGAIGYAQTKFRAEEEVARAAAAGLPVVVYRPGMLLGDSRTGAYADTELSVRLIRAVVGVGCAPITPAVVPAAPVDYAADAIVALSQRPDSIGGVYHPNLPDPIPVRAIFDHVRACGYDLPARDVPEWRRELLRNVAQPAVTMALACWEAMSYLVVPEPRYLPPRERSTLTHAALDGLPVRRPEVDTPFFARILDRLVAGGLLPPPGGPKTARRVSGAGGTASPYVYQ